MKTVSIFTSILLGFGVCMANAQVLKDPLLHYYQRITNVDFVPENDDPNFHYSPQTQVYYFEANFTGPKRKTIFITDEGEYLGAHGKYAWSVYCPGATRGYRLVTVDGNFIAAGLSGPTYVGYIEQVKRYGVVIGTKDSLAAYYLDNGTIQSKAIELKRERANSMHYPKYFTEKPVSHHVITYTLAQLAQKYAKPDPNNILTSDSK